MGKTSRAILGGVGAGLMQFGQSYAQKIARDDEAARLAGRMEKEDAFKERELTIREKEADLRIKAQERQALFDEAKLRHGSLIRDLNDAGENKDLIGQAYSKNLPDDKQWHYNDGATKSKGAYAVFNIGYRVTDPATGEFVIDESTGLPMERVSPLNGGQKVFQTIEEYTDWKSDVINPLFGLSLLNQKKTADQRYDDSVRMHEYTTGTRKGQLAEEKTEAEIELLKERAALAKRSPQAAKAGQLPTGTVMGLDGKEVELTTSEQNRLINDTKSLKELFPGIVSGEVYRFARAMENPKLSRGLANTAEAVVRETDIDGKPMTKERAAQGLAELYGVKVSVAAEILAESMRHVGKDERPWWKRVLGGSGSPAQEQ